MVRYKKGEAGLYTRKNVARNTTQGGIMTKEKSQMCVVPGGHIPGISQTGGSISI